MTPDELDALFKALADPTRRRIVDRLAERPDQSLFELCAGAVAKGQPVMSRQAVSQHLEVLEKAGLVQVTRAGRTKLHRLELWPLRAAQKAWLGRLL
ncbi:metalloregulator ArsR/SmtB family transcription factor [uncultured Devosia sp.]|uniref:ArsR/SmtB family transcription factor n=1 Tax=uncultured Devosia sp. TaxID=211434 RepID=UPI00262C1621|nr:metalloregulator ArsR/SmtB family transcription factor [uncultured Devosia sp.]